MIRNLKALSLALVAVFALSAMAASTASAAPKFTSANGVYPQHLIASDTGAEDLFTLAGSELSCTGETFTATAAAATNALSFTPNYINCVTKGEPPLPITVTHNGCTFEFTAVTTVSAAQSKGIVHLRCPNPAVGVEIHHYSNHANHTAKISNCTDTVLPQTPTGEVTYNNVAPNVVVEGTLGVHVVTHGACSFGFTLNQEASYHLSDTVSATSGATIHAK